ncbi:MAG TPA: DUF4440 domain-containing protein [Rudaea sp.]
MRKLLCSFFILAASFARAEDDAAIVQRQSQEFSDASGSGDAKVLEKYLDDDVVFLNEGGEIATKHDIVASASPPAAGISNRLVQSDWTIKLDGDVAVTSFTDNSAFSAYGQTYHAAYKSIEVWRKKQGRWRMIASQTLAVPVDPPARPLADDVLDQYVGTYRAGSGFAVKIERSGAGLISATNGGKATPLLPEVRDVLFTPGQPRTRRVFERDAGGKITGFISRREGHDVLRFSRAD